MENKKNCKHHWIDVSSFEDRVASRSDYLCIDCSTRKRVCTKTGKTILYSNGVTNTPNKDAQVETIAKFIKFLGGVMLLPVAYLREGQIQVCVSEKMYQEILLKLKPE